MGNNIGGRKKAKVMKINGETFMLRTPIQAREVVTDYPGHVLLESEAVKQLGIRAKPLQPQQELKPNKIYFLVELPKVSEDKMPRRVKSGVQMSAEERLECLMLSRRSNSDLSVVRQPNPLSGGQGMSSGPLRVKMRLPRAAVAKLVEESRDEAEVTSKIIDLYMENAGKVESAALDKDQWKPGLGSIRESFKAHEVSLS
ncbi:uncharacterized protein At1g66480-like [Cornus florida]|uniref:uncharacterized protein At1g66480-like n=1 Tax=Cornus florida TaxID=4283 RepID=UPI00289C1EDB|nr:uncharacterized protein At1g66480-like [Cornus florida]